MRYCLLLGCCVLLLSACQTERQQKQEIIKGMEQAAQQNTTDKVLRPLIANYLDYANEYKEDDKTPLYLYRAAILYYRAKNYGESSVHLERILREHKETPILEDAHLLLAAIHAGPTGQRNRADELYREYLERYPQGKGVADAEYYFLPEHEKLQDYIDQHIQAINSLPRGQEPTDEQLLQLTFAYANFVKANPEAALAPSYALEGARLAIRLEEHLVAVQLLEEIYHQYPEFDRYPDALLMLAVEYDTNLSLYIKKAKNLTSPLMEHISLEHLKTIDPVQKGKALYQEILRRFPDHVVADSARAGLKNLGKKTEEVVEEFIRIQDSIRLATQLPQ